MRAAIPLIASIAALRVVVACGRPDGREQRATSSGAPGAGVGDTRPEPPRALRGPLGALAQELFGPVRAWHCRRDPPRTDAAADAVQRLGQVRRCTAVGDETFRLVLLGPGDTVRYAYLPRRFMAGPSVRAYADSLAGGLEARVGAPKERCSREVPRQGQQERVSLDVRSWAVPGGWATVSALTSEQEARVELVLGREGGACRRLRQPAPT